MTTSTCSWLVERFQARRALRTFDPSKLGDVRVWLAASSPGSGYTDGQAVSTWSDLSGAGNHFTQGTAGARPLFRTNRFGTQPAVVFDGVDDILTCGGGSALAFTAATIFLARDSVASQSPLAIGVPTWTQEFLVLDKAVYHHSMASNFRTLGHQLSPAGVFVQSIVFGTAQNVLENYLNGVGSNVGSSVFGSPVDYTAVSRSAWLGSRDGNPSFYSGAMAEVLVFAGLLGDTRRVQVERYLMAKFNLS